MKILIVEDDEDKASDLIQCIEQCSEGSKGVEIDHKTTVMDASFACRDDVFDLLILDVLVPWCDDGEPNKEGVEDLIRRFIDEKELNRPRYCFGLTQDREVLIEVEPVFSKLGWAVFLYSDDSAWQSRLSAIFSHARKFSDNSEAIDYGIVCALEDPELESVLGQADDWRIIELDSPEPVVFRRAEVACNDGSVVSVVACSCRTMGLVAAANVATKLISYFNPKVVAMPGISAGIEGRANFGDVLIASPAWDYGSGKVTKQGGEVVFLPSSNEIPLNPWVESQLREYCRESEGCENVKFGPVASGVQVVALEEIPRWLESRNRKVIGIEMEAYSLYFAAVNSSGGSSIFFSCKAVTDFATEGKDDRFRKSASNKSAEFLFGIIRDGRLLR